MGQATFSQLFVVDYSVVKDGARAGTIDILTKNRFELGSKWIAQVMPYGTTKGNFPDHDEAKAYAHLFAASPDLLNAIQHALNLKDLWSADQYGTVSADHEGEMQALKEMQNMLEAAYLKATGQQVIPIENQ